MNKVLIITTVFSIILNIVLLNRTTKSDYSTKSNDTRTAIKMSVENKEFVLGEMLEALINVQQINEGLLENDKIKIINAGKKSGNSVIDDTPKGFKETLPLGFKKLNSLTHNMFDSIKESTENNFNSDKIQHQLNQLLYNCIACHRTYKIETLKENNKF